MRVFIAGATGVIGRRVVEQLVAKGYPVVGLSRSAANADWLRQNGAEPRSGDLFNQEKIVELSSDCQAILHLATAIPTNSKPTLADWALNDRLRREGTQVLINAAVHNHCQLYLQQSVTFLYGDHKGAWVDESTPIAHKQTGILQSAFDMEQLVQSAINQHGLPAVTLRFGSFYSHESVQTRAMFGLARQGRFPVIGNGRAYWNNLHVDDAAKAVLEVIEDHPMGLGQTFIVCDDQPVTSRELLGFVAQALGARKPKSIPPSFARVALGSDLVELLLASARCRNQLFKETFGWQPGYPTYREGYSAEIDKWMQSGRAGG